MSLGTLEGMSGNLSKKSRWSSFNPVGAKFFGKKNFKNSWGANPSFLGVQFLPNAKGPRPLRVRKNSAAHFHPRRSYCLGEKFELGFPWRKNGSIDFSKKILIDSEPQSDGSVKF
jgi:hypothetical protein